jgi:hypothetical protein
MAKGDKEKVQNANEAGLGFATNNLQNTQAVNNRQNLRFEQNYEQGAGRNLNDYDSMMNQYRSFLSGQPMGGQQQQQGGTSGGDYNLGKNPAAEQFMAKYRAEHPASEGTGPMLEAMKAQGFNVAPHMYGDTQSGNEIDLDGQKFKLFTGEGSNQNWYTPGTNDAPGGGGGLMNPLAGFSGFAQTGGFSPQDIQNIRAQSIAPIRGVYSGLMNEVQRQRKLQHGYSPNATAALAKMGREAAYATSDQTTNAEANIARLRQQGQLAGLSGLQSGMLGGMAGAGNLYGTTPGLANTFGNQVLGSTGQMLQANQLANDISRMRMGGAYNAAQIPGDFSQAMGNISQILGLGGQVAGAFSGLGGFGGAPLASRQTVPNMGFMPGGR